MGSQYTIQVKATADTEGLFSGDLSVYGNIDDVGDIVEHGFFDSTLASKTHFPLLWQHDMTQPIGSFDVVSSDGPTLRIEGRFNLGTEKGREGYALLKAGDIDGLSIGYTVSDYKYDGDGIRHLYDGELMEGSLVTFPANRLARAQAKQRLCTMEQKSRYAGLKFLSKLSEEDRLELLDELEELDKSTKADEESDTPKEDEEEEPVAPVEDEKAADDEVEDDQDILDALKECRDSIDKLNE